MEIRSIGYHIYSYSVECNRRLRTFYLVRVTCIPKEGRFKSLFIETGDLAISENELDQNSEA